MNQLLDQQLKALFGNASPLPEYLKPLIAKIDETYSVLQKEIQTCKSMLSSDPREIASVNQQLRQSALDQEQIITNLKQAIVSLEPNSAVLKKGGTTLDEASYLTESLIKLINARKQAQGELQKRQKDLEFLNKQLELEKRIVLEDKAQDEAVLFAIGDGLIVTNPQGRITMVNHAFEKMLGWNKKEVVGHEMYEIVIKEDKYNNQVGNNERLHSKAIATGQQYSSPADSTYFYVRKDKSKFPVSLSVAPIVINNKIMGAVEVFKDITKEKEIEKTKNEFVSVASHQLRTPLSSINWYTEMLVDSKLQGDITENLSYLKEVEKAITRMTLMINDLLNISRLELGTFSVEPEAVNILELTKSIIDELKPKILEKQHNIIGNYDPKVPIIKTDPKLLSMVLQNLLSNAIKYSKPQGKIIFSAGITQDQKEIFVSVKDSGYGIPKKDQDKIFSKLFRASNIMKVDTDGNGLGLYIVKSIMEALGGKIWFESEENVGTTFYFTLPIAGSKFKQGYKALT